LCAGARAWTRDRAQFGFDGDAAFLSGFTFDMNDRRTIVGGADVANIGTTKFFGA
jgi:hypothetical protein